MAFVAVIVVPLGGQLVGLSDIEDIQGIEWRVPSQAPTRPASAEELAQWPKSAEAWVNDVFAGRTALVGLNQRLVVLLGSSSSQQVARGVGGWLFHRTDGVVDIEAEHRGAVVISDGEIEGQVELILRQNQWLAEQGIPMVAALVPDKQSVYPEYLPEWARPSRPTRSDRVVAALRAAPQLRFIDTRPALVAAKESPSKPLYYLTDTHWNHRGAYVAYRKIMAAVRDVFPDVHVVGRTDFRLRPNRCGPLDLMRKHNFRWGWAEPRTKVVLCGQSHVQSAWSLAGSTWRPADALRAVLETDAVAVETDLARAPRVLVLRDSFSDALAPFFNESFREVLYLRSGRRAAWRRVNEFKPDLVLYVFLEKVLAFRPGVWRPPKQAAAGVPWAERAGRLAAVGGGDDPPLFADGFDAGVAAE